MQLSQEQFVNNFEALSEEDQNAVEVIFENNPPEVIMSLASVFGVTLEGSGEQEPQEPMQEPQEPMPEPSEEMSEPEQEIPQTDEMSPLDREMMALGDEVATTGPIQKEGADNSGVADDVPMDAEQESFVINAAAVDEVGELDLEQRIIQPAVEALQKEGIKITVADLKRPQEQVNGDVPVAVSNGEYYIPRVLARKIGYGLLKKINDRGKPETEKKLEEQKEQQPQEPQAEMQAALGKRIQMNEGGGIQERKMQVQSYLESKGLRQEAIAGIMGNIHGENSNFIFTQEEVKPKNKSEIGYGLFQFTDRGGKGHRSSYLKYLKANDKSDSMESQIDYVIDMINTKSNKVPSYFKGSDIGYGNRKALREVFEKGSVEEITNTFLDRFEKPKDPEASRTKRIDEAKRLLAMFTPNSPPEGRELAEDTSSTSGMPTTTLDEVLPGRDEPITRAPEEDPSYVPPSFGATASGEVVGP